MAVLSKIKASDNVDYNIRDDYSTWGGRNLLKLSAMNNRDTFVANSNTDFTKPFRFYNGSATIHNFTSLGDGTFQDTITLNAASNLGICFTRLATDINLDSNSEYILSCWAKTTKANAHVDIGLSYYNTSDSWVWRGGSNPKNFSTTNTWQFFTHTFKPDADTKAIMYCFTMVGVANGTDTWTIKHCKLEKGNKATDWSPAPEDIARFIGNETIELYG